MFNTAELLGILEVMKFHLMDSRSAIKTDVYKEFFKAGKDVYIIMLSELRSHQCMCRVTSTFLNM